MPRELSLFVVDDDAGLRDVISELAAVAGDCSVWGTASTGEEAIERLAACADTDRPDVVLLDVELPGIDGLDVADRLLDAECSTVVVLMSTHSRDDLPTPTVDRVARFVPKIELSPAVLSSFRSLVAPTCRMGSETNR